MLDPALVFPDSPSNSGFVVHTLRLIEANNKKVAFLREVIRGITLMNIDVYSGRAEDYKGGVRRFSHFTGSGEV